MEEKTEDGVKSRKSVGIQKLNISYICKNYEM